MRLSCLLLSVILAVCCLNVVSGGSPTVIKGLATDSHRDIRYRHHNKRYLKGSRTSVDDEERELLSPSKLTSAERKLPYFRNFQDKGKNFVKVAVTKVQEFMKKKRHASITVTIGLVKMAVVVSLMAFAWGLIVYYAENH